MCGWATCRAVSTCGAAAFDAAVYADLAVSTAVPAADDSVESTPVPVPLVEVLVVEGVPSAVTPVTDVGR